MAKTPAALVIDQDVQSKYEVKQAIRASGLTLAGEAGYGVQASVAAGELHPDIVLVSVNEPMERALQTVEALVTLLPETPVIVYSNSRDIESARKAMLAGARDYLVRPLRPDVLRQSVLKAMEIEENRRLRKAGHVPETAAQSTIVTVFGAKGGIGKSTIATNLAVALAGHGAGSVVVADLDNGFGDVAGMLDVRPERTLVDAVQSINTLDRDDLKKYLVRHEASGLDVLAAPSLLEWRTIEPEDVRRVLELLAKTYDTIVLDTSPLLSELTEIAVEMATMVLWVTTSDFASVHDSIEAMRALNMLSYSNERVRIMMNSPAPEDGVRPAAVREALQREIFWSVPYDKKMRTGSHMGQPIVVSSPQSVAARSLSDLATVIAGGRIDQKGTLLGNLKVRGNGVAPQAKQPVVEGS